MLDAGDARLMVQALDGADARIVVASATDGRLLPSGHLAFMRLGTLMTARFDLASAEIIGDPVAALGGVMHSGLRARANANNTGAGMFAVSSLGALAVVRGPLTGGEEDHLIWVTRDGRSPSAEPASGAPVGARPFTRISPDQSRAMVTVITPRRLELWFMDWARGVWTPCGDCKGDLLSPGIWSADGRRLLLPRFDSLVAHLLDRSSPDQVIVREADRRLVPSAWLADGRIVYTSSSAATAGAEIKLVHASGNAGRVVVPLGGVREPAVSPDGQWLAYTSTETNPQTVVVQALSGPGSRTPVSAGSEPVWSADGRTLYFLKAPDTPRTGPAVFAVDITVAAGTLSVGAPRELFRRPDPQNCNGRCYDVADGPRFVFREKRNKLSSVTRMDLVLNWTSTLANRR